MSDVKEMSGVGRKCAVVLPEPFKSIRMSPPLWVGSNITLWRVMCTSLRVSVYPGVS